MYKRLILQDECSDASRVVMWNLARLLPQGSEPASARLEAYVTPARWKEREECMVWVGNSLDDVTHPNQTSLVVNVLSGW